MKEIRGIAGLRAREPVGAVLRVGQKDQRGVPVDKDRFFFCDPVERNATFHSAKGSYQSLTRPLHEAPEFVAYHRLQALQRQEIRGVLIHDRPEAAWDFKLGAQELPAPWPKHPDRAPACYGNGEIAFRFFGNQRPQEFSEAQVDPVSGYAEIPCSESCPFRSGDRQCKPKGRFMFRLDQQGLPPMVVRLATQSWFSVQTIEGFFSHVEEQAAALLAGVAPNLYGLPFFLRLTERSTPKGTFPVMTMTPAVDLQVWLMRQQMRLQQLQGQGPRLELPRLADPDQRAAEAIDFSDIEPARPPALTAAQPQMTTAVLQQLLQELKDAEQVGVRGNLERVRERANTHRRTKEQGEQLRAALARAEQAIAARERTAAAVDQAILTGDTTPLKEAHAAEARKLWTIGYGGVAPEALLATLRGAGVDLVLDVRIAPHSRSQPAYEGAALAGLLEGAGISYQHEAALGNPVREACTAAKSLDPYRQHLQQHPEAVDVVLRLLLEGRRPALLCGCVKSGECHRGVIAQAIWQATQGAGPAWQGGLQVQHLHSPLGQAAPDERRVQTAEREAAARRVGGASAASLEQAGQVRPAMHAAAPEYMAWVRRAGQTSTAGDVAELELELKPHEGAYPSAELRKIRAAFNSAKKRAADAAAKKGQAPLLGGEGAREAADLRPVFDSE